MKTRWERHALWPFQGAHLELLPALEEPHAVLHLFRLPQLPVRLAVNLSRSEHPGGVRLFPRFLMLLLLLLLGISVLLFLLLVLTGLAGQLEVSQTDPNLHVVRPHQELLIKSARAVQLAVLPLEVDVSLPQEFGHVQPGLADGQVEDGSSTLDLSQHAFHFGVLRKGKMKVLAELERSTNGTQYQRTKDWDGWLSRDISNTDHGYNRLENIALFDTKIDLDSSPASTWCSYPERTPRISRRASGNGRTRAGPTPTGCTRETACSWGTGRALSQECDELAPAPSVAARTWPTAATSWRTWNACSAAAPARTPGTPDDNAPHLQRSAPRRARSWSTGRCNVASAASPVLEVPTWRSHLWSNVHGSGIGKLHGSQIQWNLYSDHVKDYKNISVRSYSINTFTWQLGGNDD